MTKFEETTMWKRTLAYRRADPNSAERERLRTAYLRFRERITPLAEEIKTSMPLFTEHGLEHIDALWDMASQICGDEYPLNPAEAFVLGGSFLMHDLGMGLAAYQEGKNLVDSMVVLEADPRFQDILESTQQENPSLTEDSARNSALVQYLRVRHARQAEHMLTKHEFSFEGRPLPLIEDARLGNSYGPTIGRLAHSHWFPVADLEREFDLLGSLPDLPPEWVVDTLKVACILRVADAAHIDSRRAPLFLHALRRPQGVSGDHWKFQQRLTRPTPVEDRLRYTAGEKFRSDEASAWWLAFDAANLLNRELQQVDALLADKKRTRFPIRGVVGAESPARFAEHVGTQDWTPVDASLRVTKVSSLVESLGGESLYGKRPEVALREIISNGADALRARRLLFGGSEVGVEVRLFQDDEDAWVLSVRDRGLGMSQEQLVAYLTDFGRSYWTSNDRIEEYPGLLSRGYRATGKYGIGFFASFMIAASVEVRSLKYRGASKETSVLVFPDGLGSRPLLRSAETFEALELGGTEVRMRLKQEPRSVGGLFDTKVSRHSDEELLRRMLERMCALLDVDLLFACTETGPLSVVIKADEWKTMPAADLYDKLYNEKFEDDPTGKDMFDAYRSVFVSNVEDVLDDSGDVVARVALAAGLDELVSADQWWWPSSQAGVYVGGMQADVVWDVMGAFVGKPTTASRNSAFPVASPEALRRWATSQARRNGDMSIATPMSRYGAAQLALSVGAQIGDLPCAFVAGGMISPDELEDWIRDKSEIALVDDFNFWIYYDEERGLLVSDRSKHRSIQLPDSVMVLDTFSRWMFPDEVLSEPVDDRFLPHVVQDSTDWDPAWWWHKVGALGTAHLVLEAAAKVWGVDPVDLGRASQSRAFSSREGDSRLRLPFVGGGDIPVRAIQLRRPS